MAKNPARKRASGPPPEVGRTRDSDLTDRLKYLGSFFEDENALAAALQVSRSELAKWRAGGIPAPEHRDTIVGLDVVTALLSGYLEPESILKWLEGDNAHLGNRRPLRVLQQGRLSEVIAAIASEKSGAFA